MSLRCLACCNTVWYWLAVPSTSISRKREMVFPVAALKAAIISVVFVFRVPLNLLVAVSFVNVVCSASGLESGSPIAT